MKQRFNIGTLRRIREYGHYARGNSGGLGLGDLGVTWPPRDPRFAGSNPAEVDEFFQDKSSGRDFKLGVPSLKISGSLKNLKPEKNRPLRKT